MKGRRQVKKNPVAHFEIYADDIDKLARFYTSIFDWTIEFVPGTDCALVKTVETDENGMPSQAGGINGGIFKRSSACDMKLWNNYVNVESLDATMDHAQKLGAKLMQGKLAVPGEGWYAILTDPQGNPFAIWQADPNAK